MLELPDLMIIAHVGFGTLSVLAGAIALAAQKGSPIHIGAGRLFVAVMVISSGLGAVLGLFKADSLYITFHAGILALTLIASGWLTARSRSQPGPAQWVLGAINIVNAATLIGIGLQANSSLDGAFFGFPAEDYFYLAGMAGLAVIGDASLIFRKSLSNRHRIARHLWRMCFGFFIAAGSAFTGPGASAFPKAIRDSGLLSLPELIIIVLMLFWLAFTLARRAPLPGAE